MVSALVLSLVILLMTLWIPQRVSYTEQELPVAFGFPMGFVEQDIRSLEPHAYPNKYVIQNPFVYDTKIQWFKLLFSYGFIFFLLAMIIVDRSYGPWSKPAS